MAVPAAVKWGEGGRRNWGSGVKPMGKFKIPHPLRPRETPLFIIDIHPF